MYLHEVAEEEASFTKDDMSKAGFIVLIFDHSTYVHGGQSTPDRFVVEKGQRQNHQKQKHSEYEKSLMDAFIRRQREKHEKEIKVTSRRSRPDSPDYGFF